MKPIKETQEAIAALKALTVRTVKALADDGKIGLVEGAGFLAETMAVIEAVNGAGDILSELRDLDNNERQVLRDDIHAALVAAGIRHRIADLADHALIWIGQTVEFAIRVKTQPPTAIPA